MFRIKVDDNLYEVAFRHANGPVKATVARIYLIKDEKSKVSEGISICSSKDQFNRNTGRKIALMRALRDFDREIRKAFWDAYFAKRGKF